MLFEKYISLQNDFEIRLVYFLISEKYISLQNDFEICLVYFLISFRYFFNYRMRQLP